MWPECVTKWWGGGGGASPKVPPKGHCGDETVRLVYRPATYVVPKAPHPPYSTAGLMYNNIIYSTTLYSRIDVQ